MRKKLLPVVILTIQLTVLKRGLVFRTNFHCPRLFLQILLSPHSLKHVESLYGTILNQKKK